MSRSIHSSSQNRDDTFLYEGCLRDCRTQNSSSRAVALGQSEWGPQAADLKILFVFLITQKIFLISEVTNRCRQVPLASHEYVSSRLPEHAANGVGDTFLTIILSCATDTETSKIRCHRFTFARAIFLVRSILAIFDTVTTRRCGHTSTVASMGTGGALKSIHYFITLIR